MGQPLPAMNSSSLNPVHFVTASGLERDVGSDYAGLLPSFRTTGELRGLLREPPESGYMVSVLSLILAKNSGWRLVLGRHLEKMGWESLDS